MLRTWYLRLRHWFSLDHRSLALARVMIAASVIGDLVTRWQDLAIHYSDRGFLTRQIFMQEVGFPWSFSLHFANGSVGFAGIMLGIQIFVALCLMVGYRTRLMTILLAVLTVSLHNRNWFINNGGDDVLRSLIIVACFLPWGKWASIDRALAKHTGPAGSTISFGTTILFLQAFAIYFVSYMLKNSAIWRQDYTAIMYSANLDIFATDFAIWLRGYPALMKLATFGTIMLEWLGPLLLVGGWVFAGKAWVVRTLICFAFIGLHIGIIITMNIGLFPYYCIGMWFAFLPATFWEWLAEKLRRPRPIVIYYDADCDFCEKMARLVSSLLCLNADIRPSSVDPNMHTLIKLENSWLVETSDGRFQRFAGMVACFKASTWAFPVAWPLNAMSAVGDPLYRLVANNRSLAGAFSARLLPWSPWPAPSRFFATLEQLLALSLLLVIVGWNLSTLKAGRISIKPLITIGRWIHVYQEWNMFSPFPKQDNTWVEIPAELDDGSSFEFVSGEKDVHHSLETRFPQLIPNEHWRKFYLNISENITLARLYGGYLCRIWNEYGEGAVPGRKLRRFSVHVFSRLNMVDGSRADAKKRVLWNHWCFDEDYQKESKDKKSP